MELSQLFGTEKISRILRKLAPPVMLAQLIQALYNIVDSLFVGKYGDSGLTALSIIYPMQLLMIALAVGTGVGINTVMAARLGVGREEDARRYAGLSTPVGLVLWVLFAVVSWFVMPCYARMSTSSPEVIRDVVVYGRIVCTASIGLFLESVWTKVHQANGDMKTPTAAQIAGAITNIVLDPLLIFGLWGLPRLGIAGAAIATVVGQMVAAAIVFRGGHHPSPTRSFYPKGVSTALRLGFPNMLMQSAYTFYILGLNLILAGFSDQAVTALGIYYKWQTFFFIPLGAMQTCIVPIISFNYAAQDVDRCRQTVRVAAIFGWIMMFAGMMCYELFPVPMVRAFTQDAEVARIAQWGFRIIGVSFLPQVTSLLFPVFFQAVGSGMKSSALTVARTVVLFVPLGVLFSRFGLSWFWFTFPVTETVTSLIGLVFYRQFLKDPYHRAVGV